MRRWNGGSRKVLAVPKDPNAHCLSKRGQGVMNTASAVQPISSDVLRRHSSDQVHSRTHCLSLQIHNSSVASVVERWRYGSSVCETEEQQSPRKPRTRNMGLLRSLARLHCILLCFRTSRGWSGRTTDINEAHRNLSNTRERNGSMTSINKAVAHGRNSILVDCG